MTIANAIQAILEVIVKLLHLVATVSTRPAQQCAVGKGYAMQQTNVLVLPDTADQRVGFTIALT